MGKTANLHILASKAKCMTLPILNNGRTEIIFAIRQVILDRRMGLAPYSEDILTSSR